MKDKYLYNTFLNLHTVSGITMSVALFVCFLAGAFALFHTSINKWEANAKHEYVTAINYDKVVAVLINEGYSFDDQTLVLKCVDNPVPFIQISSRIHLSSNDKTAISLKMDPSTYAIIDKETNLPRDYIGSFLLDLHHFNQIPDLGNLVAGFMALFLLLTIITGVIIYWKKLIPAFLKLRLTAGLKTIWTDFHTTFGTIGLPFQFVYALSGAVIGLGGISLVPSALVVYDGDIDQALANVFPIYSTLDDTNDGLVAEFPTINQWVTKAKSDLEIMDAAVTSVELTNYGKSNSHLMVEIEDKARSIFYNNAYIIYHLQEGSVIEKQIYNQNNYTGNNVMYAIRKIHFGQFGGYAIKVFFFLMAIISCGVILSGVMVWISARNNKKYKAQRQFNTHVISLYLGISLGLLPAIALMFCMTKILPSDLEHRFDIIQNGFFVFWVAYTLYAFLSRDQYKINKHALLIAGGLGLFVPLLNGLQSGLWLWQSWDIGHMDSCFVDVSWLIIGGASLYIGLSVKRMKELDTSPVSYQDIKNFLKNLKQVMKLKTNNMNINIRIINIWLMLSIGVGVHMLLELTKTVVFTMNPEQPTIDSIPVPAHMIFLLALIMPLILSFLTLYLDGKIFKIISMVLAILLGLLNTVHVIEGVVTHPENYSQVILLLFVAVINVVLVIHLNKWRKQTQDE